MLSKKVETAVNEHITAEMSSAYLYLSMAAHFHGENLDGFAHWMHMQHQEEQGHAMKLFKFVVDRSGRVRLGAMVQPPVDFPAPQETFQRVLDHERQVSSKINGLYRLSLEESDYPLQVLLHWFIQEQVEEEKVATTILERLKRIGDDQGALLDLDRELATRAPSSNGANGA